MITPTRIDLRLRTPLHQQPSSPKRTKGILFWIPFFSSSIGISNHVGYIKETLSLKIFHRLNLTENPLCMG